MITFKSVQEGRNGEVSQTDITERVQRNSP